MVALLAGLFIELTMRFLALITKVPHFALLPCMHRTPWPHSLLCGWSGCQGLADACHVCSKRIGAWLLYLQDPMTEEDLGRMEEELAQQTREADRQEAVQQRREELIREARSLLLQSSEQSAV